jgi:ABC-type branched-subunit amino acid transport system substrate-binding protein
MTGPYSANGSRVIKGAEMAAEEINAAGGIKALAARRSSSSSPTPRAAR